MFIKVPKKRNFFVPPVFFIFFCKYLSDQSQKQQITIVLAEIFRMMYKLSCLMVKIEIKLFFDAIFRQNIPSFNEPQKRFSFSDK